MREISEKSEIPDNEILEIFRNIPKFRSCPRPQIEYTHVRKHTQKLSDRYYNFFNLILTILPP